MSDSTEDRHCEFVGEVDLEKVSFVSTLFRPSTSSRVFSPVSFFLALIHTHSPCSNQIVIEINRAPLPVYQMSSKRLDNSLHAHEPWAFPSHVQAKIPLRNSATQTNPRRGSLSTYYVSCWTGLAFSFWATIDRVVIEANFSCCLLIPIFLQVC